MADPPMAYVADPEAPVWAESVRFAEEVAMTGDPFEPEIIRFPEQLTPPYGMITTQTCDLVEADADPPGWPWAQLVPVYDMDEALNSGEKRLLRQGRFAALYCTSRHSRLVFPSPTSASRSPWRKDGWHVKRGLTASAPRNCASAWVIASRS